MVRQARASGIPSRELFEKNPLPMWVYDQETLAFLAVNAAAIRQYGYSREEFLALTIKEIRPPEELPALLEKVAQPVEGHDAAGTWRYRKKDGSIIDVEITTHTLRFAGRKAKLVLANDITERKRQEQGFNTAAREWRKTFDAMDEAIAWIDRNGRIVRCNRALTILTKKNFHDIIGHHCEEVVYDTAVPAAGCPIKEVMATHKRATATLASGSRIYKVSADPLFGESGEFIGAIHMMSDITQQERAEKVLKELVLQQEALLNNIPDIAWLKDDQGRFLAANTPFEKVCGFAAADLVGKTDFDIWPRALAERYRVDDAEVIRSGQRKIVEEPLADKEGKTTWIETIRTPIIDDGGRVVGTTGIARDITARHRTEDALRHKEHLLSEAQRIAHIGSWEADFATGRGSWSEEMHRIYGTSPSMFEPTVKSYLCMVHPQDRKTMAGWIRATTAGKRQENLEFRVFRPDGTERWVRGSVEPLFDAAGKPIGVIGTAQDITKSKYFADALRASEKKFRTLFEAANDAIFIVDLHGRFIDLNTVAYERLGYTREEMLPKSVADLDPPEFAARVPERIEAIRKFGKAVFETAHIRKDGTVMPVEINARVIDYEGRRVLYSIVRDISERKKAEREILAASELLDAISRAQSQVIVESPPAAVFSNLLESFLGLTLSQYGFIGEILAGPGGGPLLLTHAITNIAWDEETRALYDKHAPHFEFSNLQTLFGEVIATGKPVIANDPAADPRRGGLPPGHPALDSFLGLPFCHGDTLIGMVGIANRPVGYDEKVVEYLQPLLSTCGSIIAAYRNEARRKQAEEAMAKSEKRYRDLFENASDAIFLLDAQKRYLDANRKAEELTGYTLAELRDMSVYDFIPSSQAASSAAEFKKLETLGSYEKFEGRIRCKNGEYIDVEVSSSAIVKDGILVGSRDVVRDITERTLAEKAKQEQMQLAEFGMHIGTALNSEGTMQEILGACTGHMVSDLGAAFARIWTVSPDEKMLILQASSGIYTHRDGPHGLIPLDENLKIPTIARTRRPHLTNAVIGDPQVNQEWAVQAGMVAFAGYPLQVGNHLVGVLGLFSKKKLNDFTFNALESVANNIALGIERSLSEEALKRYSEELSALSIASNELLSLSSLTEIYDGICLFAERVFGVELVWLGLIDAGGSEVTIAGYAGAGAEYLQTLVVTLDDSPTGRGPAGLAIRSKQPWLARKDSPEYASWRAASEKCGFETSLAVPLISPTDAGTCIGALNLYSRVPDYFTPDRVRLCQIFANQAAIAIENARLIEGLEIKVAARTRQIEDTNIELQHLNQELELRRLEAESASRTKSDFLANMSHELRTPLNAIIGFSDIMVRGMAGPLAEQPKEYLGDILASGKHLLSLINDILDLSKVEAGKMEIEPAEFGLAELIDRCLVLFREKAARHRLDLRAEIEGAIEPMFGDERKIRQVLYNLLSNAVKFTPDGGSVIVRTIAVREDGRDYAEIAVSDSGIGISPEEQKRLFQPFSQLSHHLTKEHEGTGLGLALSKSFVEMHGGRIRVESDPGRGSTFTFRIPRRYEKGVS